MKRLKTYITNALMILLLAVSMVCTLPRAYVRGSAAGQPEVNIKDTLFFMNLDIVRVDGDYIYVYDKADHLIKVIDGKTKKFKEERDSYSVGSDSLNEILFYKNLMLLPIGSSMTAIDKDSFEPVQSIEGLELLEGLESAASIQIVSTSSADYLVVCPSDPTAADICLFSLQYTENVLTITNKHTFRVNGFQASISGFTQMYATAGQDEKVYIIFVTDQNIYSFGFDGQSPSSQFSLNSASGLDEITSETLKQIAFVNIEGQSELAVLTEQKLHFFTCDLQEHSMALSPSETEAITLDPEFTVKGSHGQGNYFAIIDDDRLKIYDFTSLPIDQDGSVLDNDQIHEKPRAAADFEYYMTGREVEMKATPYSTESVVTIPQNSFVAVIGDGYNEEEARVYGYEYCIYTVDDTNYYGYIDNTDRMALTDPDEYEYIGDSEISVHGGTFLYALPSVITDSTNTNPTQIPSGLKLTVLDPICGYHTEHTNPSGRVTRYYLLVSYTFDEEEYIGFIDAERIVSGNVVSGRITPNATVMRNNSEIFTEASSSSPVITYLDKGFRVKVIGKRDTITNFTKVTFNDENGNEVVGYIYTYNLEADSWNMVELIGILLVTINVILLVIIVCVKNKVTR